MERIRINRINTRRAKHIQGIGLPRRADPIRGGPNRISLGEILTIPPSVQIIIRLINVRIDGRSKGVDDRIIEPQVNRVVSIDAHDSVRERGGGPEISGPSGRLACDSDKSPGQSATGQLEFPRGCGGAVRAGLAGQNGQISNIFRDIDLNSLGKSSRPRAVDDTSEDGL